MARRNRPSHVALNAQSPHLKEELANAAARLMAEGGVSDYGSAKRKALKQLGLPEGTPLPGNEAVEAALREYQHLFFDEEHETHLRFLRETAVELMRQLERFTPYLTGSVLDGTAGPHSSIDLILFADSAKEVEIFLLNEDFDFDHGTPKDERVEAVYILHDEDVNANLIVMSPHDERVSLKHRDGRNRKRARLPGVQALLDTAATPAD